MIGSLIIQLILLIILFGIVKLLKIDRINKIFLYIMLIGFYIYSGIGIVFFENQISINAFCYQVQWFLFSLLFIIASVVINKFKEIGFLKGLDRISESKIIVFFAIVYLFTFVYKAIFSGVELSDFLNIKDLFVNYRATSFAVRMNRRANIMYTIITNQVSSITMPFFYIFLYKIRRKPIKFIGIYLIPVLLELVSDGYMSRNKLAIYFAFIFIYLVTENYISKKTAKKIVIVSIPLALIIFSMLENIRSGMGIDNMLLSVKQMMLSEISFPKYYDYCELVSKNISLSNYMIYIFVVCIPSQLYNFFSFTVPNLAYSFTEAVIGLSYGETSNYYILLPSVLGEAIMLFGKNFAFVYGFIYGAISTMFLKLLKGQKCLKFLMIFYLIDFFRQFRGGSQYVITAWETQLIPLIILVVILTNIKRSGGLSHD